MKCPKCKKGKLFLYKETEMVYYVPLNSNNKISVRKYFKTRQEYGTLKDYLICDDCETKFNYEMEKAKVIDGSLSEI